MSACIRKGKKSLKFSLVLCFIALAHPPYWFGWMLDVGCWIGLGESPNQNQNQTAILSLDFIWGGIMEYHASLTRVRDQFGELGYGHEAVKFSTSLLFLSSSCSFSFSLSWFDVDVVLVPVSVVAVFVFRCRWEWKTKEWLDPEKCFFHFLFLYELYKNVANGHKSTCKVLYILRVYVFRTKNISTVIWCFSFFVQ